MRNVYNAVRPLYIIIKTFGLFPMSFDGSIEDGCFTTKWPDFVVPFFNVRADRYINHILKCYSLLQHHGVLAASQCYLPPPECDWKQHDIRSVLLPDQQKPPDCSILGVTKCLWQQGVSFSLHLSYSDFGSQFQTQQLNCSVYHEKHQEFAARVLFSCLFPLIWTLAGSAILQSSDPEFSFILLSSNTFQLVHNTIYVYQFSCAALAVKSRSNRGILNQMQCRNKKLSNVFFAVNYNVVLVVRKSIRLCSIMFSNFTDFFNYCDVFGHNLSVWLLKEGGKSCRRRQLL